MQAHLVALPTAICNVQVCNSICSADQLPLPGQTYSGVSPQYLSSMRCTSQCGGCKAWKLLWWPFC